MDMADSADMVDMVDTIEWNNWIMSCLFILHVKFMFKVF